MQPAFSKSEAAGLHLITPGMQRIYSVGVSTGGIAEIRMAQLCPQASIIATTIDEKGAKFSQGIIAEAGLSERITIRLEDISQPLSYETASFDYVYARLVLHYLPKQALQLALSELYRVLKPGGKFFVVVRSTKCPDARSAGAKYDSKTGLTEYINSDGKASFRHFHTQDSIREALEGARFTVQSIDQYDEQLFIDYERQRVAPHTDNVLEVMAQK
jgi:cyclopropane fatty-acyl-phospholipid synthase-like methyltransferase